MLDKDTGINSENNRSEIILKSDSEEKINRNGDSQIYLSQKRKHITVLQVLSHCLTLHLAKWGIRYYNTPSGLACKKRFSF